MHLGVFEIAFWPYKNVAQSTEIPYTNMLLSLKIFGKHSSSVVYRMSICLIRITGRSAVDVK